MISWWHQLPTWAIWRRRPLENRRTPSCRLCNLRCAIIDDLEPFRGPRLRCYLQFFVTNQWVPVRTSQISYGRRNRWRTMRNQDLYRKNKLFENIWTDRLRFCKTSKKIAIILLLLSISDRLFVLHKKNHYQKKYFLNSLNIFNIR